MDKGNIVKSKEHGTDGLLLALTKDGKRAKVKVFGHDDEVWRSLDSMTVIVSGDETCGKCGGSGIFQGGGGMLNGKFTGYTGECYACQGKGKQDNGDRLRNHYYWHRTAVVDEAVAEAERGEFESLERTAEKISKPKRPKIRAKVKPAAKDDSMRDRLRATEAAVREGNTGKIVVCRGCGTVHADDTLCPE